MRIKNHGMLNSVVGSKSFDKLTQSKLDSCLINIKIRPFNKSSLHSTMKGGTILEVCAGWGRNVPRLLSMQPRTIDIVDLNPEYIARAKKEFV